VRPHPPLHGMPARDPYAPPTSDIAVGPIRRRGAEAAVAILGCTLAFFSDDLLAWFVGQTVALLPLGSWAIPVRLVVLPFLIGLLIGAAARRMFKGRKVLILLLSVPFLALAMVNNLALAVYFGWPAPPTIASPWFWLHAVALPGGIFLGASTGTDADSGA